jgi:hypothetical protein
VSCTVCSIELRDAPAARNNYTLVALRTHAAAAAAAAAAQVNEYNWRFPFALDLSFNRIAELGATILCTALRSNKLITKLDLRGNNLHDRGAGALSAALKFNTVRTMTRAPF